MLIYQRVPINNGDFPQYLDAKRREWMGLGVAGMTITSDEMDHA